MSVWFRRSRSTAALASGLPAITLTITWRVQTMWSSQSSRIAARKAYSFATLLLSRRPEVGLMSWCEATAVLGAFAETSALDSTSAVARMPAPRGLFIRSLSFVYPPTITSDHYLAGERSRGNRTIRVAARERRGDGGLPALNPECVRLSVRV